MSSVPVFTSINEQMLRKKLEELAPADLIAVTLTDTSILLGGVFKFWQQIWDEEGVVALSFNTEAGKRFGNSCFVHIPISLIAGISVIPLDDTSTPKLSTDDAQVEFLREIGIELDMRLPVQDYPNPLASIIYEHNMSVIESVGFKIVNYMEKALSTEGIPTEGIHFDDEFLIYADWAFLVTQAGGGVTISAMPVPSIISIEKHLNQSPEQQVIQRLKGTLADKLHQHVSPTLGSYTVLQGCLLVPDPAQDDVIEGEECYLYQIVLSRETAEILPVLMKVKHLKYPLGFISRISSKLNFYGELLPIPVNILGENYSQVLLARAIAYLKD
jgi:hypothetical protein